MKTIKVKYVGFWREFEPENDNNVLVNAIKRHYIIEESDNPDYIICSVFRIKDIGYYDYCRYPQIRIMYSGENYIPDLNLVDYAVSSYPIKLQDRHLCFPVFLDNHNGRFDALKNKNRDYTPEILLEKPFFANFIAGHESEFNIRGDFFKRLSEYKRVESFGSYLNNQENNQIVTIKNKTEQQKKCKFTLCFESTKHEGFITEKITDAFFADTIPVYYGSSDVTHYFNENAFINCSDYDSFEAVIQKIIEIDNDDEKYLSMLRQPIFRDIDYICKMEEDLDRFVCNIFEQPLDKARRRSRVYCPESHEKYILGLKDFQDALDLKEKKIKLSKIKHPKWFKCKKWFKKKKNNLLEILRY